MARRLVAPPLKRSSATSRPTVRVEGGIGLFEQVFGLSPAHINDSRFRLTLDLCRQRPLPVVADEVAASG